MTYTLNDVERHQSAHELTPQGKYTYRGVDYTVALGGPFKVWFPVTKAEEWFWKHCPDGYYEFEWVVLKDGEPWIGGSSVIDRYHDIELGYSEADRHRMRVNAARKHCEEAIDNGIRDTLGMTT